MNDIKQSLVSFAQFLRSYGSNLFDDLKFFGIFGVISSLLMELTSFLPAHINRGLFSTLISDHIPFYTMVSVLFIQILALILYQFISWDPLANYLDDLVKHLSLRVEQLSSPAISVIIGMSITSFGISFFKGDQYLAYAKFFALYALIFFLIAVISSQLKVGLKFKEGSIKREFAKVIGVALIISLVITPILNSSPMNVSYEVSVQEYEKIVEFSAKNDVTTEDLSRNAVLERIK